MRQAGVKILRMIAPLIWMSILEHAVFIHSVAAFFVADNAKVARTNVLSSGSSVTRLWSYDDDKRNNDPTKAEPSITAFNDVPRTPCNRICRYNANVFYGQVCIGCFRETFEIAAWQGMSSNEKCFALMDAMDRLEQVNDAGAAVDGAVSKEELQRQADYWNDQAKKS
jgi:predicted Fe-S protein YdhL (DUF1289 family)